MRHIRYKIKWQIDCIYTRLFESHGPLRDLCNTWANYPFIHIHIVVAKATIQCKVPPAYQINIHMHNHTQMAQPSGAIQYLAQGHFYMQTAGNQTTHFLISRQSLYRQIHLKYLLLVWSMAKLRL